MNFFKNNWVYILWFILFFTFSWIVCGATWQAFLIILALYGVSILLALSPFGEWILKQLEGVRELQTSEEIDYLEPLFEEVYEEAKELYPKLNTDIQIHLIDANFTNAFAIGRKTVAVTTGAVHNFSEDELKGVIAHELGHIYYGHTKALLLSVVGNLFFSVMVLIAQIFLFFTEVITAAFSNSSGGMFALLFARVLRIYFNFVVMVCLYISNIVLALNSRTNEFQADEFAFDIGFGEELTEALYLLQKISGVQRLPLLQRLASSHPHIAKRIARLEKLAQEEE